MEGFTIIDGVVAIVIVLSALLAYSRGFVREARLRLGEAMASSAMFGGGRIAAEPGAIPREARVRQALGAAARLPQGSGDMADAALDPATMAHPDAAPATTPADIAPRGTDAPEFDALPAAPVAAVQVSYRRRRHVVVTAPGAAHAA